jgi:hypothetical protein
MRRRGAQMAAAALLAVTTVGECAGTFLLHKEHPLTMEVPRSQYPLSAIAFIRAHDLRGNLLVFFDWGELCLWELPECAVSIDGRWETCYPRELIPEHWKFYNDEPVDGKILDIGKADLALLPANLAGRRRWPANPDGRRFIMTALAVVLVREPRRYPKLALEKLPEAGPPDAAKGRAPFPDGRPPGWSIKAALHFALQCSTKVHRLKLPSQVCEACQWGNPRTACWHDLCYDR